MEKKQRDERPVMVFYVNVAGKSNERAKARLAEWATTYADPDFKQIFIPVSRESEVVLLR